MVGDNTILADASPLLPDRYPQQDFFVCDVFDAAPKGDMAAMEHPIFSIATKPDMKPRHYARNKNFLRVAPSELGLATVHDRDVLIYCISQLIAAHNQGRTVSQVVRFKAYDLLVATNRGTDGRGYEQLRAAFKRLQGTQIETNITTGDLEQLDIFSMIDRVKIVRQARDGRMQEVEVRLSDWVFNAIQAKEVLTLHRDYFRLRKPLERRMYELARKHCGAQKSWKIGLVNLHTKVGSSSTEKEFRRLVRAIIRQDELHNHMPDYSVRIDDNDMVEFVNRRGDLAPRTGQGSLAFDAAPSPRPLKPDTFADARQAAPGWDIYYLESEWRSWTTEPPRNPDAAFIGFCRQWFEKRGRP
jgi:hypothetical protein